MREQVLDRLVVDLDEGDLNDDLTVPCLQLPDLGKNKTKTPGHLSSVTKRAGHSLPR